MEVVIGAEEGVFGHDHHGLGFGGLEDVLWHVFLVHDQAEGVLVEPLVGHDDVAFLAAVGTPRVLHFPLQGFAIVIQVNGAECHGVR